MSNMFKCTLASGGALILTVTCDSAFAGQTITCTDGTTTLTQTCPSTSPYTVEFRIPNGGTWTISSGTASTSVVIPDEIRLHNIPNGSTITPTDDVQIWLHCANIWDKSYTTITQVLNDASTLQALIASNNASDYMARSTIWASDVTTELSAMTYIGANNYCADVLLADSTWRNAICDSTNFENVLNVKVPTMTSDTTPSGRVIYSSQYSTSTGAAYNAFANNSSEWMSANGQITNQYLGYMFTSNVKVNKIVFHPIWTSSKHLSVKNFRIEASDDNSSWSSLYSGTLQDSQSQSADLSFAIANVTKYRYYRLFIVDSYGSPTVLFVKKVQFYGRI